MFAIVILPIFLGLAPAGSDVWPGFRNDGTSRTTAQNLPLNWTAEQQAGWRAELPGYGQSAPVVWKDRVYVTAIEGAEKETLHLLCLSTQDGKEEWRKTLPASQRGKNNPMMSRAAPTPLADASGVYAFYESGDLFAFTHTGEARWQRHLAREFGELKNNHGLGSSPIQTDRSILILLDHQGPSCLLAVDKADGTTNWKAERPQRTSWTTPVVTQVGDHSVVVVSSGGAVTAYDALTGKQLWEMGDIVGNSIPSPTMSGDLVVIGAAENPRKPDLQATARSNCCLKLGASGLDYSVVWRGTKIAASTASPLVHAGHVYIVDKNGFVHCLDLQTGEERYRERLASQVWATPVGAGDRVYFFGKDGVTTVISTGPSFEVLATNRLWSTASFQARLEAAKKAAASRIPIPPKGKGPGGGPPASKKDTESAVYSAVGDVVYGVAAVNGAFFVRTGTELICIRIAN